MFCAWTARSQYQLLIYNNSAASRSWDVECSLCVLGRRPTCNDQHASVRVVKTALFNFSAFLLQQFSNSWIDTGLIRGPLQQLIGLQILTAEPVFVPPPRHRVSIALVSQSLFYFGCYRSFGFISNSSLREAVVLFKSFGWYASNQFKAKYTINKCVLKR